MRSHQGGNWRSTRVARPINLTRSWGLRRKGKSGGGGGCEARCGCWWMWGKMWMLDVGNMWLMKEGQDVDAVGY
ncbi:hypothetical protein Pmani_005761 [Petrolisthes manimaculis]|uniref:Uncharacterized protein n=1 Tax=Petrolisthes manimaculis TaxID=1843537 RepID=A0AAE1QDY1_9EUCA|nr:hypothetical protein Pmani_005761 [Petrolisthes manimaculis]